MSKTLAPGKLPMDLLKGLLERYTKEGDRVVLGPGVGRDAAVIDFGDRMLVAKTDPITFAAEELGWYAVHVNANDVASMGARPKWFLATVLLPEENTEPDLVEDIFRQIGGACETLGIAFCGGHTEVTLGLDRPIVTGCMLGEVLGDRLVRPDRSQPGDRVVLTKGIAIEGTAVLAREHPKVKGALTSEEITRFGDFIKNPGISVVREALLAADNIRPHAMHDPTEGGLATALHELAEASGVGLRIHESSVPIFEETRKVCGILQLNPFGLLASGALLIVASASETNHLVGILEKKGVRAVEIGEITQAEEGVVSVRDGLEIPIPVFTQDEVARGFLEWE